MRKESLAFLERLVNTPSPSGFEKRAQALCRAYVSPHVDRVWKDSHGNQYAVRNGDASPRVLLDAHIDEVGMMVNAIDDDGFVSFRAIGGVDTALLYGQRVLVHGRRGPVPGVVGRKPPHLTPPKERGKIEPIHRLWIDIAATGRARAERAIAVGDAITVDAGFERLMDDHVVGRGFDDRMGCFVILEAMRRLARRRIRCGLHCVTSVQEELGMRGARTSAHTVNPDVALAVEFGWTTDHPGVEAREFGDRRIGRGPVLHRGPNINPVVERQLVDIAKKRGIPHQMAAEPRGTPTNANAIQLARGGVATGLIRVPGRYLHSPVEIVALSDVEHAVKLVVEWVCSLRPGMDFTP
ncbi:MAG: M42 family metallopeptidase [bacterium]|nr:M42 family metallopeptidase [bacterium]